MIIEAIDLIWRWKSWGIWLQPKCLHNGHFHQEIEQLKNHCVNSNTKAYPMNCTCVQLNHTILIYLNLVGTNHCQPLWAHLCNRAASLVIHHHNILHITVQFTCKHTCVHSPIYTYTHISTHPHMHLPPTHTQIPCKVTNVYRFLPMCAYYLS